MIELVQDGVVTCVAVAAASMILRRVVSFARPGSGQSPCGSCGSRKSCASPSPSPGSTAPLVLHGSLARSARR